MTPLWRSLVVPLLALCLSACTGTARLYDTSNGTVTYLRYKFGLSGHGSIRGTLPSGEKMNGEYSTVPGTVAGWGSIYASVQATETGSTATATGRVESSGYSQHGTATMVGDRGGSLECEYVVSTANHGYGGCRSKAGTLYKIHF